MEETQGGEVVEVPFDARGTAGGRGDVRLTADPDDAGLRGGRVAVESRLAVSTQRGGEGRRGELPSVRELRNF